MVVAGFDGSGLPLDVSDSGDGVDPIFLAMGGHVADENIVNDPSDQIAVEDALPNLDAVVQQAPSEQPSPSPSPSPPTPPTGRTITSAYYNDINKLKRRKNNV